MTEIPKPDPETQEVVIGDQVIELPSFQVYVLKELIGYEAFFKRETPSKALTNIVNRLANQRSENTLRNMRNSYESEQEELRFLEARENAPESEKHKFDVYTQAEIDALENDKPEPF